MRPSTRRTTASRPETSTSPPPTRGHLLVVVLGPTASGKSELALTLAERFHGEVVNFDSVQVYRGFDVGTAKLAVGERRGIPHHLIDIVAPEELFTAGDYARRARAMLAEIRQRQRLPIMVGGTGLYLRAALQGLFPGPQRDEALRKRLTATSAAKPPGYLHRLLGRLDRASAQRIHPHDAPKLIRAIEVSLRGASPMSAQWRRGREGLTGFHVLRVGLDPPRDALRQRIRRRAERMFQAGLVEEVRRLLERGVCRHARPLGALGYRQALACLDGRLSLEQAIEDTAIQTGRYAKRQMTWFRREGEVRWFSGFGDGPALRGQVVAWIEQGLAACGEPEANSSSGERAP